MIIPKKDQKIEKRVKNFNNKNNIRSSFEFRNFSKIKDFRSERKRRFNLSSKIKGCFNIFTSISKNIRRFNFNNFSFNSSFYKNFRNFTSENLSNFEINFNTIFTLNTVIFIFILIFYLNIFSYYSSFVFLNKMKFPKDYFIDTFLYYSDQNITEVNNYLFGTSNPDTSRDGKKPFVLKIVEHKINPGETLSHIASRYGTTSETLISYNDVKDVRSIRPGLVIKVPNMNGVIYSVKKNDSLSSIASIYNIPKVDILDANDLENEVLDLNQKIFIPGGRLPREVLQDALGESFIFPVQGIITSGYGYRPDPFTRVISFHNGIDIANIQGTPIRATKEGVVVVVASNVGGYGKYVIISHSRGFQTLYGHMNSFSVGIGQRVERGQVIGHMGSTGYSTGNHLHFTIFQNGKTINPIKYLK